MSLIKFYNSFHRNTKIQDKIISENNFTYYYLVNFLNKNIINNNRTLLDYGCGAGVIDLYLANKGHTVYGVDISDKAISHDKKSAELLGLSSRCIFKTIKQLNVNQRIFDAIICSEVVEHVKDDTKLLSTFSKLLKGKGLLFLTTPSKNAPLYKIGLLNNFDKAVGHIRRYDNNEIVNKLHNSGFTVLEIRGIEGIARNALYTIGKLNFLIKFMKGPVVPIFMYIDRILVRLFGNSNILILAQKT